MENKEFNPSKLKEYLETKRMMNEPKEFNLSETENSGRAYARKHIKEFIKKFKERFNRSYLDPRFISDINKLAGDKLK